MLCICLTEHVLKYPPTIGVFSVGSDYDAINEDLTFQPGASPGVNDTECFHFTPTVDTLDEGTEDVNLIATSTDPELNFTEGGDMAIIFIHDATSTTTPTPTVTIIVKFTEECYWVSEDGPAVHICVVIVAGVVSSSGLIVNVTDVAGGSATGKCSNLRPYSLSES